MISTKATALANSNTALIKYWGKQDEELIIPMNNSISLTVDSLSTTTTVEFSDEFTQDLFILNNEKQTGTAENRVIRHLDLLRSKAKMNLKAKVMSQNNFPTAAGLASSASGFAALTVASCKALELELDQKQLSMLSRRGSGSSARSIFGGFVEWIKADEIGESYAKQLADKNHFDIRDIVVIFKPQKREFSTREAMKISKETSPMFKARLDVVETSLDKMRKAIEQREFNLLGQTAESDCNLVHSIALTSTPKLSFWIDETIRIINLVKDLRQGGIDAFYTVDTGSNMHILTLPQYAEEIDMILRKIPYIEKTVVCKPGDGAKIIDNHLF
ncbi:MAG: diphosphomevalonate decarboxylase [Candidatus Heimdallarchaeota archaeon]|nr:diphosphomevalonate decarboxylase [Candidatus Heimdallarchaeota archaeon]MBY8993815.1 diphosphomevalonate decarboxylase [Candidatus Heimdallarchaeota archaeon]